MDWDLILIFGFVLTLLAIILPFGYIVTKRDQQHKLDKLAMQARIEEAKAAQSSKPNEVQAHLEDRLRVLERIVTDPSADLSRQIEDLRELQADRETAR